MVLSIEEEDDDDVDDGGPGSGGVLWGVRETERGRHIKEVGQFVHASVKVKVGVNDAGVRHFA